MIRFPCAHCGAKYELNEEFAGRHTRCRTCRQPLTVPGRVVPMAAPARIDGPRSSLHQLGVADGVTLSQTLAHVPAAPPPAADPGQRYLVAGELGRGGMGLVLRAVDRDIRREVAVKYLLDPNNPNKQARFVEEAQITGQLEHPNIAPVYDLDVDAQKRLFFTMKLVRGRSLAQILDEQRRQTPTAKEYSLGRLLGVLVNVCHALAYAHARGVLHRDLKPANIMLGDFGAVYVMDWGLAKVLNAAPTATVVASQGSAPQALPAGTLSQTVPVATNRGEEQAELTQEGAVLGTPVYMPPEQAGGRVHDVDQRSDVYALGAILYEMLTLQPPVVKEGNFAQVLYQVLQGKVIAPAERTPERARQGLIPAELSAIALKALAKEREQRYPNVDALRQDVERYLEGRSVSAKQDTFREAAWKLVKRNRAVSAVTAAAVLLLGFVLVRGSWANYQARRETEQAYRAYREQVKQSVPAFVRSARLSMNERGFDDALQQIEVAVQADPEDAAARLLRAELRIAHQQFEPAGADLEKYLEQRPDQAAVARLRELCRTAQADDVPTLNAFYKAFFDHKRFVLADRMTHLTERLVKSRQELLEVYRQRIETAWPGRGDKIALDREGRFHLNLFRLAREDQDLTPIAGMSLHFLHLTECNHVRDLAPLKGMPLTSLDLNRCSQIRDLAPLRGMPLTRLDLTSCNQIRDLTPLRGMTLTTLVLTDCVAVQDVTPLEGMPLQQLSLLPSVTRGMEVVRNMTTLKTINSKPAAEFWKEYDAKKP